MPKINPNPPEPNKFHKFLDSNHIKVVKVMRVSKELGNPVAYRTLMEFRHGTSLPTSRTLLRVCEAVSKILKRKVELSELI